MLSFRTMFEAKRAKGVNAHIGFRIGAETFAVDVADGRLTARRGDPAGADVTLTGTAEAIAALVYGGASAEDLEAQGALRIDGDRRLARRFAGWFPLPPKFSSPSAPAAG